VATAHGEGEDTDSWRNILGGLDVMVIASFLHSIGAILMVGGLIQLYSRLKTEETDEILSLMPNRLIYSGLILNLIGGASRLFEPGHPSLNATFEDRWVSVMLVKHLFVIILCVASIYATRSSRERASRMLATRMSLAAVIVIGVLGALAGVIGPV
jgi:hypothetical protein